MVSVEETSQAPEHRDLRTGLSESTPQMAQISVHVRDRYQIYATGICHILLPAQLSMFVTDQHRPSLKHLEGSATRPCLGQVLALFCRFQDEPIFGFIFTVSLEVQVPELYCADPKNTGLKG